MFAPLLDAFIESTHLPHPIQKKPLALGIKWYADHESFKWCLFYDILSHQYDLTLESENYTCFLSVHHRSLEDLAFILKIPTKRLVYMGENERIDLNVYDFGMGFDDLEFGDRYLRLPLYYQALCSLAKQINAYSNSPFQSVLTADISSHIYLPHHPQDPFCTTYPQIDGLAREQSDPLKRGFASFVASNPNAPVRNAFYQELKHYHPVAGGGGCLTRSGI
ncbi:hypothetical protein [Helicobacter heilmannii]|uniref:hypothetical protein n=2 Tax=Helicobacter heilmannii TaxID=35817 RepID=UPI0006A1EF5B|nr:hypothetical protein [Helicobacter heilmannii]CRF46536.1 ALPHA (1,3)-FUCOSYLTRANSFERASE [Helicobacter heilmannii]